MSKYSLSRRGMVRNLGVAGASFLTRNATYGADAGLQVAGQPVEIQLPSMSRHTFRLTVQLIQNGKLVDIADDGTLLETSFGAPVAKWGLPEHGPARAQTVKLGDLRVMFTPDPLALAIETANGEKVQHIHIDRETAVVSFTTGTTPIL